MADIEKQLPHSPEAEKAVLGSVLIEPSAFERAHDLLEERHFYTKANRLVWQAMSELYKRGEAVDTVTVTEELRKQGTLADAGGTAALADLVGSVATAAHVEHYSRIVAEKAVVRELIRTSTEIVERAYSPDSESAALLEEAESKIFAISQKQTIHGFSDSGKLATEAISYLEKLHAQKSHVTGVSTGFTELDKMTSGFQRGDLIIVAGRPSQGKTAFAMNIAANVVLRGVPVAVFSLEMDKMQIFLRMLCGEARVDLKNTRSGYFSRADWPKLTSVGERLADAPLYIDSTPGLSVMDVRTRSRRLAAQLQNKGKQLGMIVIDYLQLLRGDFQSRKDGRQQEVSEISRQIKHLARNLNVPVVALSQLNRRVEEKGREGKPQLSDLRESGAIEQDADVVGFIYREEYYKKDDPSVVGTAEFIIEKQRNGPIGSVPLRFTREYTRFDNRAKEADEVMAEATDAIL